MSTGWSVFVGEIGSGLHSQFVFLRGVHLASSRWSSGRAIRR